MSEVNILVILILKSLLQISQVTDWVPPNQSRRDWTIFLRHLLIVATFSLFAGCGNDHLPTYEVTGNVFLSDGTPLPGGWIVCESFDHGIAARGIIETDGSYRLGTYSTSDGAVAGRQLIAITPASPVGYDPDDGDVTPLIHPRFLHMDTSGLELVVQPNAANHFELVVEKANP